jgi:hypothetical protein
MKKLLVIVALLGLVSCETKVESESVLIPIEDNYFLKKLVVRDGMSTNYVFLVVDENGHIIQGASANYSQGKTRTSATSVVGF